MKILITSDWHADAKTIGHARFLDVDLAVGEMVRAAVAQKFGAFLFLGDLCDPDSGSACFRSVEVATSAACELSRAGVCNVWVAGNHDVIEDGSGDTTLSPLRPLVAAYPGLVHVMEQPGMVLLGKGRDGASVYVRALPFAATSRAYAPRDHAAELSKGSKPHFIVAAHLAVAGVQPGEETTDMPRGREVLFPRECFPSTVERTHLFNGHYHRQQVHQMEGFLPVHIPGAPARFTFGEAENAPGYMVLEV